MTKIVNMHDDFPVELFCDRFFGLGNGEKRLDWVNETFDRVVGAIYLPTKFKAIPRFQQRALNFVIANLLRDERFKPVRNKRRVFLSLEGLDSFESASEVERTLNNADFLSLTWARENAFAYGVGEKGESGKGGLKSEGRYVAEIIRSAGNYLDVSHLNDKGVRELIDMKCPIFASHSNSREAFYSKRNLTPCEIRAIADHGGVIGINGYKGFIAKRASIFSLISHVKSLVELGGESVVALGLDVCGNLLGDNSDCDLLKDRSDIIAFESELLRSGFTSRFIDKLLFKNADRFLNKNQRRKIH